MARLGNEVCDSKGYVALRSLEFAIRLMGSWDAPGPGGHRCRCLVGDGARS